MEALQALRVEYADGATAAPRLTIAEFLKVWLRDVAAARLRPSSYRRVEGIVRVHLIPALGRHQVSQLRPQHVNQMLRAKARSGLAPKTCQHIRTTLRTALGQAVKWEIARMNAAALSEPPRAQAAEIEAISRDDARAILDAVRGDRLYALYAVALGLGLRQGEALALQWRDVDLEGRTLVVRQTLHKLKDAEGESEYQFLEPKTRRSRRTIVLPDPLVVALREHGEQQLAERQQLGQLWATNWGDLVFATESGRPLHGPTVTRRFQAMLKASGLPRRRFHDLRHACATLLLAQGVPARVVMEVLGHATIAVTMNTYSHVLPELQREAADRMGEVLAGADR